MSTKKTALLLLLVMFIILILLKHSSTAVTRPFSSLEPKAVRKLSRETRPVAPGEFLSGGLYVQAPSCLVSPLLPVELCSGRPNCGATQSFGEKLRRRHDSFVGLTLLCSCSFAA